MLIPNLASILGSEAAHQGAGAISKVRIQWGDTIFLGLLQKKKKWILFQNLHKFKNENMLASFIILGSKLALVKTLFFTFKIFEKKKKKEWNRDRGNLIRCRPTSNASNGESSNNSLIWICNLDWQDLKSETESFSICLPSSVIIKVLWKSFLSCQNRVVYQKS